MPKTFTSDIGEAFPSAIDGPLQIADPQDPGAFIKIDPATAAITAAGTARPMRRLHLPMVRTTGAASHVTVGTGMVGRLILPGNTGGFFTGPIWIPPDFELTQPCSVYVLIAAAGTSSLSNVAVRVELLATYTKDGQAAAHDTTVATDVAVPDNWANGAVELAMLDDGNGRTFPGNTFEAGDVLAGLVRLNRGAASDTFDKNVVLVAGAMLEYTAHRY